MIFMYAQESDRGPLLMCGILPEDLAQVKAGQRVFVSLAANDLCMPQWTISVKCGAPDPRDGDECHVAILFESVRALDHFVKQKMTDFPKEVLGSPFNLILFYTESAEKILQDVVTSGIGIERIVDNRPGGMVN